MGPLPPSPIQSPIFPPVNGGGGGIMPRADAVEPVSSDRRIMLVIAIIVFMEMELIW
jgi:hypothetical protein